jgi:hypothetical protein
MSAGGLAATKVSTWPRNLSKLPVFELQWRDINMKQTSDMPRLMLKGLMTVNGLDAFIMGTLQLQMHSRTLHAISPKSLLLAWK